MALTREEQELILRVYGEAEVIRLTKAIRDEEAELVELKRDFDEYNRVIGASRQGTALYEAEVARITKSIGANRKELEAQSKASRDYRTNITALGYAVNDFASVNGNLSQRLNAIANNLPGVLDGFGKWGLILSGVVPVIAAALPMIEKLYEELAGDDSLKNARGELEKLRDTIKEIEKNPVKFAVDIKNLEEAQKKVDEITKGIRAFEEFQKLNTGLERESGARVNNILSEARGGAKGVSAALKADDFTKALAGDKQHADATAAVLGLDKDRDQIRKDMADPDLDVRAAAAARAAGLDAKEKSLREVQRARENALRQQSEARVGNAFDRARGGDQAAQEDLADRLRRVGRGDLADELGNATIPAIRAQRQAGLQIGRALGDVVGAAGGLGRRLAVRRQERDAINSATRQVNGPRALGDLPKPPRGNADRPAIPLRNPNTVEGRIERARIERNKRLAAPHEKRAATPTRQERAEAAARERLRRRTVVPNPFSRPPGSGFQVGDNVVTGEKAGGAAQAVQGLATAQAQENQQLRAQLNGVERAANRGANVIRQQSRMDQQSQGNFGFLPPF